MINIGDHTLLLNEILRQLCAIRELLRQMNEAMQPIKKEEPHEPKT